jgi:hypothetical protein
MVFLSTSQLTKFNVISDLVFNCVEGEFLLTCSDGIACFLQSSCLFSPGTQHDHLRTFFKSPTWETTCPPKFRCLATACDHTYPSLCQTQSNCATCSAHHGYILLHPDPNGVVVASQAEHAGV